jgi:ribose transport system substrate-binding protein
MKNKGLILVAVLAIGAMLVVTSCQQKPSTDLPVITIGIVAKSQANAVFQAAHAGALDAAKELGKKYGVEVKIDIRTPPTEDAMAQAQAIDQLTSAKVQGIAISCSDANTCAPAIDKAVEAGVAVMCFDSDAPTSKRFCCYGTDDEVCGEAVMKALAEVMGDKGTIAILAGNQTAPNLQARKEGVMTELAKHPNMSLLKDGVFYHKETPEDAAERVNSAQNINPSIGGWAMVGGWPLFTQDGLKWDAGKIKVVAVDALPAELPYLKSGHVTCLFAQDCYGWGYKSVDILLDKIVNKKDPQGAPKIIDPLTRVTKDNAAEWETKWKKWLGK